VPIKPSIHAVKAAAQVADVSANAGKAGMHFSADIGKAGMHVAGKTSDQLGDFLEMRRKGRGGAERAVRGGRQCAQDRH